MSHFLSLILTQVFSWLLTNYQTIVFWAVAFFFIFVVRLPIVAYQIVADTGGFIVELCCDFAQKYA